MASVMDSYLSSGRALDEKLPGDCPDQVAWAAKTTSMRLRVGKLIPQQAQKNRLKTA